MRFKLLAVGFCSTLLIGCLAYEPAKHQRSWNAGADAFSGSPAREMAKASSAYQRGSFQEAATSWAELSRFYREAGRSKDECDALTKLAKAYQALGFYDKALQSLESALILAKQMDDPARIGAILASIGDNYLATGPLNTARKYLQEALAIADNIKDPALSAAILNSIGNLESINNQHQSAIAAHAKSVELAESIGDYPLAVTALNNAAMVSIRAGEFQAARAFVDRASGYAKTMPASHDKAFALVNIGWCYLKLAQNLSGSKEQLYSAAEESFNLAISVSEEIKDPRAASYAFGYLGELCEQEHRYDEALQLSSKAIAAAQRGNAPESLYRWQWQTGRLLRAIGHSEGAIPAYREATATIQSIRAEMSSCYGSPGVSFRETAGPLYLEFVDLLLQQASSIKEPERYERNLREAREVVELLRVFELRDYFRDDCVATARAGITRLDLVSKNTLIIYPIILPDRTELLVSLPSGMKLFSVRVKAETVTEEIRSFRKQLEKLTTREYLPQAQKLYDWLIRPMDEDLKSAAVDTMVFVPDGPLRTIPMAALHDGKLFLIQKYAVAVTPGLDLTDPRPIARQNARLLALGITESAQGYPPLPYVSMEIDAIQELYHGKVLLNSDFILSAMGKTLSDEHYTIVHIASHGQFAGDVNKTFLVAFDGKLTMDRLDQYVGLFRFREDPLELLTLSACETAAGDDRAALGLAGVAVKAGARSALATLWYVNDQASSILVAEFYRQLQNPSNSRATALQRAQLQLLDDRRYQHPRYWSPFLLINNWL